MTNEQLAVVLQGIQSDLDFEIRKIREKLPEDCFVGRKNLFDITEYDIPILDDINGLSIQLGNKISILIGEK